MSYMFQGELGLQSSGHLDSEFVTLRSPGDGLASCPVSFFQAKGLCSLDQSVSVIVNALSVCVNTHLAVPIHNLISCDSDILASVFLTRRAVRREAGFWAQHSVMSFPICLKH